MADGIVINAKNFHDRLASLYNAWKADKRSSDGSFAGADSLAIITGKPDEETVYHKNNAIHVSDSPAYVFISRSIDLDTSLTVPR